MCGCNKSASLPAQEFEVRTASGRTETFTSEPEARVFATMHNGKVTVKKK